MKATQITILRIPATHAMSSQALSFIAEEVDRLNHLTSDIGKGFNLLHIRLALDEALLNAVEHGCRRDENEEIQITARFSSSLLEIQVEDFTLIDHVGIARRILKRFYFEE